MFRPSTTIEHPVRGLPTVAKTLGSLGTPLII
jgi:hypothetical protein